ncbi:zinc finger protein 235 [Elysia marginata]|uniref:Zinc finger protein 235 n=1 Tax=Elysia marginata TaxID=1093978 RepID=A0AAV4FFH5_9GAST|nr:zinc finger protein 235 [Elysia marginata]
MAEPNHVSEFTSDLEEGAVRLADVQFTLSDAGYDINDLEGSVASGADVVDVIETVHEESETASLNGSLWDPQQNESFVNFKGEEELSLCNRGIKTSQVNEQVASASGNITVKESSADDFLVYNLCSSVQNDSAHLAAAELSSVQEDFTGLVVDNYNRDVDDRCRRKVDDKGDRQISTETEKEVTRISSRERAAFKTNEEVLEEIPEDSFKDENISGDSNFDASSKTKENIVNQAAKNARNNFPQRERSTRVANRSLLKVTVKRTDKARVKSSIAERFACDHCSKTFKFSTGLDRHMKKCHPLTKFKCEDCSLSFVSKTLLANHILTHLGLKPSRHTRGDISHLKNRETRERIRHRQGRQQADLSSHSDALLSGQLSKKHSDLDMGVGLCDINSMQKENVPSMESQMSDMFLAGSKFLKILQAVSFLAEKSKTISQLTEMSSLAYDLANISSNVLRAFKCNLNFSTSKARGRRPAAVAAASLIAQNSMRDVAENNIANGDEVDICLRNDGGSPESDSATTKKELHDSTYLPPKDLGTTIKKDFKKEPLSSASLKENILKPGTFRKTKDNNGKVQLHCTRCEQIFCNIRNLKRHIMIHDDLRPYPCSQCSMSFRRKENLKKHMATHSDERPFKCSQCPFTTKTSQQLQSHVRKHVLAKSFSCPKCSYTSRTQYELNHHLKRRHKPRKCSQCDFICHNRLDLKKHMAIHTTLSCPHCDFNTSNTIDYKKHMRKHLEFQPLCCELCGYSCNSMKKFKYHMLRHENKTPFQCPDCDYKCSSRASFDCHRLKHAGLRPYLCSVCGAAFRKSSNLNQHMLIHKDEKAYKCDECDYSCRTSHNLKEHKMTHTGEKPFKCNICDFSSRRKKALMLHMEKHRYESLPEVSIEAISASLPPPYQVNLGVPLQPSVSSMQLDPKIIIQPAGMQSIPLQVPLSLMPPGV